MISRQIGESIILEIEDSLIEVRVVDIAYSTKAARIGIIAPRNIPVHRKEIILAMQKEVPDEED